jgi:hypothetical protein
MINFIQLHQNINNLENIIITDDIYEKIHRMILEKENEKEKEKINEIIKYIFTISEKYNIDKTNIIIGYSQYVIKSYPIFITCETLDIIESVIHIKDTDIHELLKYFFYSLIFIYSKINHKIRYTIFDTFEVNLLQYYFLKLNKLKVSIENNKSRINLISSIKVNNEIYYKNNSETEKIIVDKCRSWTIPENIELLKKYIDKDFKIIILERPIIEIVNSFVKLYQKNNKPIDIDKLLEPGLEPIMRSLAGVLQVKESQKIQKTPNFLFISYSDLIENTQATIQKIYDFCNWEPFQHDFQNIIPKYKENDEIYGLKGFHDVSPTIINNNSSSTTNNLPTSIIEKCMFLDNILNQFTK